MTSNICQGLIWSLALLQSTPVLVSVAPVTTKDHANTYGMGHHLRPCWCLRLKLQLGPNRYEWPGLPQGAMVIPRPRLWQRAMCRSVAL